MRALLITTAGTITVVNSAEGQEPFAFARKQIGAKLIEPLTLNEEGLELMCNEEGLLVAEPQINLIASYIATHTLGYCYQIVGDVLLARYITDGDNGAYGDLTDEMITSFGIDLEALKSS
ncbi:MAG: hypothetical protein Q4D96_10210 [Propionibacteriaceae bacterium]|nr:hypothetical protein [Propionibacteriaceae bacterium]